MRSQAIHAPVVVWNPASYLPSVGPFIWCTSVDDAALDVLGTVGPPRPWLPCGRCWSRERPWQGTCAASRQACCARTLALMVRPKLFCSLRFERCQRLGVGLLPSAYRPTHTQECAHRTGGTKLGERVRSWLLHVHGVEVASLVCKIIVMDVLVLAILYAMYG